MLRHLVKLDIFSYLSSLFFFLFFVLFIAW
nr:MAG TPA: hypothetical protein [Caudoviricetes sp.]